MRMTRRRWLLLLPPLLLVAVVAGAVLLRSGPHPCRATFEKVREGMTREEVYATVGGPPDQFPSIVVLEGATSRQVSYELWDGPDASMGVHFGDDGRATWVNVADNHTPRFWERIRNDLGL